MTKNSDECYCRELSYILHLYNNMFSDITSPAKKNGSRRKINRKHYHFIPTGNTTNLLRTFKGVHAYICKRNGVADYQLQFLDCGCGIGNIMALASIVSNYSVTGLEYDKRTLRFAKKLMGNKLTSKIIHSDITKFRHYEDYDVIYYYHPICDRKKMKLFSEKLANDAKVGVIIIANGPFYDEGTKFTNKRFKYIKLPVYSAYNVLEKIRQ